MINTEKNIKAFQRSTGRKLNPHPIFVDKVNDHGGVSVSHVSMPAMSLEAMDAMQAKQRKPARRKKRK